MVTWFACCCKSIVATNRDIIDRPGDNSVAEERVQLPNARRGRRIRLETQFSALAGKVPGVSCRDLRTTPDVLYLPLAMNEREKNRILRIIKQMGLVRPIELEARGVPRAQLYGLVREGLVERQARGVYAVARHPHTAEHSLAQVAKRVPAGVFCLLTALRFHGLTTQSPAEVWIALPEKARKPRLDYPRLRVARFSGAALSEGIETHKLEAVEIRVYSAAKTVADCFKYRNKVGIDVAVEALRDFSRKRRGGANELARFARICRVSRVMQPYLDSIA
jgi:predicted transcriptional regulator of viral defense system